MYFRRLIQYRSPDKLKPLIEQKFLENADEEVERLLAKLECFDLSDSDKLFLWMYKGWIHCRKGENALGKSYADRILAETAQGYFAGKAHHLMGLCQREEYFNSDDDESTDALRAIFNEWEVAVLLLSDHPERFSVISSHASLLSGLEEIDEAINLIEATLSEVTENSPELGWLYATLGEILIQDANDWERGKLALEKSIKLLDPIYIQHGWVHALLAMGYNSESKFEERYPLQRRPLS